MKVQARIITAHSCAASLKACDPDDFSTLPVTSCECERLRVAVCKDRESAVSDPFGESLIFCPKLVFGRLFSKIIFKSSNDFVSLGNLRKIKSADKMRSKCGFLVHLKVRL